MRKSLIASIALLLFCLASMAASPTHSDESAMTPFKFQPRQQHYVSTGSDQSNRIFFKDLTSKEYKEQLGKRGSIFSHSFAMLNSENDSPATTKVVKKLDEQTYTLTVNLNYGKENIIGITNGAAYPNYTQDDWFSYNWTPESTPDKIEFIVPSGSYDVEVILCTSYMDYIVLTATDVEVVDDKQISLDASDATVEITWNGVMPDGAVPFTDISVHDPDTSEVIDYIVGNAYNIYNCLDIQNTKHNRGNMVLSNPITMIKGESKIEIGRGNVRIMPNSEYKFYFDQQFITQDGGYCIVLTADALESATVTNDISDYIVLQPEFVSTPHQPEPKTIGQGNDQHIIEFNKNESFGLCYAYMIDGAMLSIASMYEVNVGTEIKKQIHTCQSPTFVNSYKLMPVPIFLEDWDFNTLALPVDLAFDSSKYLSINNTSDFSPYLNLPDDSRKNIDIISNPWLSFDTSKHYVWNYGCPILVFSVTDKPWVSSFDYAYIGRLGENRSVDLLSTEVRVSVDNAAPSNEVLEYLQYGELPEEGKIEFQFTDTNVSIDGIKGRNLARIGFDMSQADHQPPTLQMLRFLDTDGNITDRYAKGEDGIIEFYGGDFKYHFNAENYVDWYTEETPIEVKVEYSPYGKSRYTSLDVENIVERDFMPGFGTYYSGSLAGVDRKSENGWFDVRITLTDAEDNFQQQTISPAFKIDENLGVETLIAPEIDVRIDNGCLIVCGSEDPIMEIYLPNGILFKRVTSSIVDVAEFVHGIYFVKITDGSQRVVRKVCI